ncbi:MAG: head GIN domain-containing protein [Erythrobacter sp.]
MLDKLLKAVAPVAAIAVAGALAGSTTGCKGNFSINGMDGGVPLDELDMSGDAPDTLLLAAPVEVILKTGKSLKIAAKGDDEVIERLRFSNKDGELAIGTDDGNWGSNWSEGVKTVVNVTMPAPKSISIAGSGSVSAPTMAKEADITLAASGSVTVDELKSESLTLSIAGSGNIKAAGSAEKLELNIAGSGGAEMGALSAEKAEVTIAGSGSAVFASDGKVKANIMGSGDVRVVGRADCEVSSVGSGSLKCEAPAKETEPKKKKAGKKKSPKKKPKG